MLRLSIFGRFRAADALGNEIPIKSKKARALLAYLALPAGKERSREEVMALLWSERGDNQARSSLRQALSGLRKELGRSAGKALKITDEWIALDPGLVAVEPASPDDVLLTGLHISDPAFEEWLRDERLRTEAVAAVVPLAPEPPATDKPSIAVLPFVNMSGDPEQEYFSDGIAEEIITALSKIPGLLVISRNSTFTYKGRAVDGKRVSLELSVRYILEGSVRMAGNRVRVTTQLSHATTGHQLWAERYDRDLQDIFAVQDEITREVVIALDVKLSAGEQARFWSSGTRNFEAWQCIRLASDLLNRAMPDGLRESRRLCNRAIELDPNYAMAWVILGWSHHNEVDVGLTHVTKELRDVALGSAIDCAKRALELDKSCASAYSLLAICHLSKGVYDKAIAMSEKAVVLAPSHAENVAISAIVQTKSGRPERALDLIRKSLRLCPIYPAWFLWALGTAYRLTGQLDSAIATFKDAIKRDPDYLGLHVGLASILGEVDKKEDATACVSEILRLDPDFSIKSYMEGLNYRNLEHKARFEDGLLKAGLPK